MFDFTDDYGYYLTKDDEGPFLLIFDENGVTLVLPHTIEDSPFCKQIFIVAYKLKVPAQKKMDSAITQKLQKVKDDKAK